MLGHQAHCFTAFNEMKHASYYERALAGVRARTQWRPVRRVGARAHRGDVACQARRLRLSHNGTAQQCSFGMRDIVYTHCVHVCCCQTKSNSINDPLLLATSLHRTIDGMNAEAARGMIASAIDGMNLQSLHRFAHIVVNEALKQCGTYTDEVDISDDSNALRTLQRLRKSYV